MTNQETTMAALAEMVLSTVEETQGQFGTPSGPMYAAFMAHGISLANYTKLIDGLVGSNFLHRRGAHCLAITDKGKGFLKALHAL
jgi:hypothetical protein